jgi:hypothetical protein
MSKEAGTFEEDRRLFQLLIDHPLETLDELSQSTDLPLASLKYRLSRFFEQYQCGSRTQILSWERLGLHPFFLFTDKPFEHPYAVRSFLLAGGETCYLTQCVTPGTPKQLLFAEDKWFEIRWIYTPTNDIQLLYDEAHSPSYNEAWLLNLKEEMVEEEIGDIVFHQETRDETPIEINADFLAQLAEIYNYSNIGRYDARSSHPAFIQAYAGLIAMHFHVQLPKMATYLLIIDKISNPRLFVGGFIGRFPLTEIYECPNALIIVFQTPEMNFGRLHLLLFQHLKEICQPHLWQIISDSRMMQLQEQWVKDRWMKFAR